MKQMSVRIGLGVILCGLLASPATAAPITFSFTGVVNSSNLAVSPPFNIGQTMSGFFTVDGPLNASTDSNPSANIASHNNHITNLSVTIGASTPYTATFGSTANNITIRNLPAFDQAQLEVNTLVSGAPVNGFFTPTKFDINLRDGSAGAFNSQYPTTVPSLGSFLTTNQWRLVFGPGARVVSGTVLTLQAVPLPAAVILFGAGLVALAGLGAGSWRQRKTSIVA